MTYPNARAITYNYGTGGGMNDALSRIESIKDGSTTLAGYTYLGLATVIRIDLNDHDYEREHRERYAVISDASELHR